MKRQTIKVNDQVLTLVPKDELLRNSHGGAFRVYWVDCVPIYLDIPRKNNNISNWTDEGNWKAASEVTINKQSISIAHIQQWLRAAESNEKFLQHIGIIFDDEYFGVKKLYEDIYAIAEAIMEPHVGKYDSRDLKINLIL